MRTNGDHPNYGFIKIGQNTEKSPKDLRRLAVTQTSVKIPLLTLIGKNSKSKDNNNLGETTRPYHNQQKKRS